MDNTEKCQHTNTRLRKRMNVQQFMVVQLQCRDCFRAVGPATPLDRYNAREQRVLEPWADGPEMDFKPGPRAA